ncbi:MAG: GNAT family N-acetyltransferase, partial [Acidobacteriota bacterium]
HAVDGVLGMSSSWGFELESIASPVYLWHGRDDTLAPVAMAEHLAATLPNCRARYLDETGHFLTDNETVIAEIATVLRETTPDELIIRPAHLADAPLIAQIADRTFRDAFAATNAADDLEAYMETAFSVEQTAKELGDEANTFFVAMLGDRPVGYAKVREHSVDPSVRGPEPVELERLYVDQHVIGRRIGAKLMRICLDTAQSRGYQTLWLGVWEHNPRAIAFYERWGFERVGAHVFRLGTDDQTDLVMERPVLIPD